VQHACVCNNIHCLSAEKSAAGQGFKNRWEPVGKPQLAVRSKKIKIKFKNVKIRKNPKNTSTFIQFNGVKNFQI
jgi:hypothetical protein